MSAWPAPKGFALPVSGAWTPLTPTTGRRPSCGVAGDRGLVPALSSRPERHLHFRGVTAGEAAAIAAGQNRRPQPARVMTTWLGASPARGCGRGRPGNSVTSRAGACYGPTATPDGPFWLEA